MPYIFTLFISLITILLTTSASALAKPPNLFALKTKTDDPRFNDLCVKPHHTGAGRNACLLVPCTPSLSLFHTHGTSIGTTVFFTSDPLLDSEPSHFSAVIGNSYKSWYPTEINAGMDDNQDFQYDETKGFSSEGMYGFLACEWNHEGAKQLFVMAEREEGSGKIVGTCARVRLMMW